MASSLLKSVEQGDARLVAIVLKSSSQEVINKRDEEGRTSLFLAARDNRSVIAQLLINAGAQVDATDGNGDSALCVAASDGCIDVVKILIESHASLDQSNYNGWTPLIHASYNGHDSIVCLLLAAGANISIKSKAGCTALYSACNCGHLRVADLLAAAATTSSSSRSATYASVVGIIDAASNDGLTPLAIAARKGHGDIVSALLRRGAHPARCDADGWTPLMHAVKSGAFSAAAALLGADVVVAGSSGASTVTDITADGGTSHSDVLQQQPQQQQWRRQRGAQAAAAARINAKERSLGRTALHWAVTVAATATHGCSSDMVRLLVSHGANVALVDNLGLTPADLWSQCDNNKHHSGSSSSNNTNHGNIEVSILLNSSNGDLDDSAVAARKALLVSEYQYLAGELLGRRMSHPLMEEVEQHYSQQEQHDTQQRLSLQDERNDTLSPSAHSDVPPYRTINGTLADDASALDDVCSSNSATTAGSAAFALTHNLQMLASASPQAIAYLAQFGSSASTAAAECASIAADPSLREYYGAFSGALSGVVLAAQAVASGVVADSRQSVAETVMGVVDGAASFSGVIGLPLVTGLGRMLLKIPNDMARRHSVQRVVTYFPSIDSHKYIEMLARSLTLLIRDQIKNVLRQAKRTDKKTIFAKALQTVEWLQSHLFERLSPVQSLAVLHAAAVTEYLMCGPQDAVALSAKDVPALLRLVDGGAAAAAGSETTSSAVVSLTFEGAAANATAGTATAATTAMSGDADNSAEQIAELTRRLEKQEAERNTLARKVSDLARQSAELAVAASKAQQQLQQRDRDDDDDVIVMGGGGGGSGGEQGLAMLSTAAAVRSKHPHGGGNGNRNLDDLSLIVKAQQTWQASADETMRMLILELQMLKETASVYAQDEAASATISSAAAAAAAADTATLAGNDRPLPLSVAGRVEVGTDSNRANDVGGDDCYHYHHHHLPVTQVGGNGGGCCLIS